MCGGCGVGMWREGGREVDELVGREDLCKSSNIPTSFRRVGLPFPVPESTDKASRQRNV